MSRIARHQSLHFILSHRVDHGGHQHFSCAGLDIGGALLLLPAKGALHNTVLIMRKRHAETVELPDDLRRVAAQVPNSVGVSKIHAALHRILIMLFYGIMLSHGIKSRIDAALRHD